MSAHDKSSTQRDAREGSDKRIPQCTRSINPDGGENGARVAKRKWRIDHVGHRSWCVSRIFGWAGWANGPATFLGFLDVKENCSSGLAGFQLDGGKRNKTREMRSPLTCLRWNASRRPRLFFANYSALAQIDWLSASLKSTDISPPRSTHFSFFLNNNFVPRLFCFVHISAVGLLFDSPIGNSFNSFSTFVVCTWTTNRRPTSIIGHFLHIQLFLFWNCLCSNGHMFSPVCK